MQPLLTETPRTTGAMRRSPSSEVDIAAAGSSATRTAAPSSLTLTAGPEGSTFSRTVLSLPVLDDFSKMR